MFNVKYTANLYFAAISHGSGKEYISEVAPLKVAWCDFGHILFIVLKSMEECSGKNSKKIANRDYHCYAFGKRNVCCKGYCGYKENIEKSS